MIKILLKVVIVMNKNDFFEYYQIVRPILESKEFQKRKKFRHHEDESVYEHSLKVSLLSYKLAKKCGFDYNSAAIGGLLHDFYSEPWQDVKKKTKLFKMHGFVHAREAYKNSRKYFDDLMTPKIKDIIVKHMFPLNPTPPRYMESWIVTFSDKVVSSTVLLHPASYPKYLGIKRERKNESKVRLV